MTADDAAQIDAVEPPQQGLLLFETEVVDPQAGPYRLIDDTTMLGDRCRTHGVIGQQHAHLAVSTVAHAAVTERAAL